MTAGMEVNIIMLLNYMMRKKLLIKLLLWFRSLLAEHKIPDVVASRLQAYIPDLSENVPNIQLINKCLENDISYLNSREELMYINHSDAVRKKKGILKRGNNQSNIRKYYSIRIISYYDIIEVDCIMDRIFVIDIEMDDPNNIFNFYKKTCSFDEKAFYYSIKLSTLKTIFN
jgi:hypothetical protein